MFTEPRPSPLLTYLRAHPGLKAAELARRMVAAGYTATASQMSHWKAGNKAPEPAAQLALEVATFGEVTPKHWAEWRRDRAGTPIRRRRADPIQPRRRAAGGRR